MGYRDPRCRIAPTFPDHQCRRRDDRPLQPGDECYLGHQRPSLLDEAHAEQVVDGIADQLLVDLLLGRCSSALDAWETQEALDMATIEAQGDEQAFVDWLMGLDA
jgi:hypothetical protein